MRVIQWSTSYNSLRMSQTIEKKIRAVVLKLQHAPESAGAPESPLKTRCWARPQFSDVGGPWGSPSLCLCSKRPGRRCCGLGHNRCLTACRWRSVSLPFPYPPGAVPSCHALVFQNAWNQPGCNFSLVDVFTVLHHYHVFSCSAFSSNSAHHSFGACISFLLDLLARWWLQLFITSWQAGALRLSASRGPQRDSCTHHWTQSCVLCWPTEWIRTDPAFHLIALWSSVKIPIKWSGASCYYKNREVITTVWDHIILGRKRALLSCFKVCVSQLKCFSDLASPRELKKK